MEVIIDIDALVKQKEKAKRMERKWSEKVSELDNLIIQHCTHTHTAKTTKFVEGGYLNVSEYHTIQKCLICNKELARDVKYGTYA